jgi:hypothetical protein
VGEMLAKQALLSLSGKKERHHTMLIWARLPKLQDFMIFGACKRKKWL